MVHKMTYEHNDMTTRLDTEASQLFPASKKSK